jgi:hypothetical protein
MALRTLPTGMQDAMTGWWPSRHGAGDEAGALNPYPPENLPLADRVKGAS